MTVPLDPSTVRPRFPALAREVGGRPAVFLDGPAGSQVPLEVAEATARYLTGTNANHGGAFATSRESDALVLEARRAAADFVGAADPCEIVFGPNMTTLTFALARTLARGWKAGDEVVVTRLDHDANVTPWTRAAASVGAEVRFVPARVADATLDLDALDRLLSPRTRLVAIAHASNAFGTVHPVREITARAHEVGAEVFVDAVHGAPHLRLDASSWGCDWLVCSAYKFFGPHVGVLHGKRERLEGLPVDKVRPASEEAPERWETGTPSFEGIAGTLAAIEYLASIGRAARPATPGRRQALDAAFEAIRAHERDLASRTLAALSRLPGVEVRGIADPSRLDERVPTFGFTVEGRSPRAIAEKLAESGVFVWSGNFYAVEATRALGLEPDGVVRAGFLHYNAAHEVDRLIDALA